MIYTRGKYTLTYLLHPSNLPPEHFLPYSTHLIYRTSSSPFVSSSSVLSLSPFVASISALSFPLYFPFLPLSVTLHFFPSFFLTFYSSLSIFCFCCSSVFPPYFFLHLIHTFFLYRYTGMYSHAQKTFAIHRPPLL